MTTDDELDLRLDALPTLGNAVPARVVLATARARTVRRRVAVGVSLAAVTLIAVASVPQPGMRARGVDLAPAVVLEAVAEGPTGPRPITGPLGAGEAVVFRVRTAGPGLLTVDVDGARVWPAAGAWEVGAGTSFVGGERPLAWTPDIPRTEHAAVATLCPSAEAPRSACTSSTVVLRWR